MGRACTICQHDAHEAIDNDLTGGVPLRRIAERHGDFSIQSLQRHQRNHISPTLRAVAVERERLGALTLADRVEALYGRAEAILDASEADGRGSLGLGAIRELRSLCELMGRLSGELDERAQVAVINVQSSADWISLRSLLLQVLAKHPAARADVVAALAGGAVPDASPQAIEGQVIEP